MSTARTYPVGLPVWITVADDGTVSFELDVSEAADAVAEVDLEFVSMLGPDGQPLVVDGALLDADVAAVEAFVERHYQGSEPLPLTPRSTR